MGRRPIDRQAQGKEGKERQKGIGSAAEQHDALQETFGLVGNQKLFRAVSSRSEAVLADVLFLGIRCPQRRAPGVRPGSTPTSSDLRIKIKKSINTLPQLGLDLLARTFENVHRDTSGVAVL